MGDAPSICLRIWLLIGLFLMADIESFVKAPSHSFFEKCTKELLLRIAAHYEIDVADKKLKENIKVDLKFK